MISSEEEFTLLLRKWHSEEIQVAALAILDHRFVVHVKGHLKFVKTLPQAFMVDDGDGNNAIIHYSNCQFGYGVVTDENGEGRKLPEIMNEDYDEYVRLVSEGGTILIFSIGTKAALTRSE